MKNNNEKKLLRKFNELTDDDILNILKEKIPEYIKLIKSEEIAIEILSKYGIKKQKNNTRIDKINTLNIIKIAKLRNIEIPRELYDVDINNDDIIARIIEFNAEDHSAEYKKAYLFYANFSDNLAKTDLVLKSCEQGIENIDNKYSEIIKAEFGIDRIKRM